MPNLTHYFTKENAERLKQELNQSGLLNELLTQHYSGTRVKKKSKADRCYGHPAKEYCGKLGCPYL